MAKFKPMPPLVELQQAFDYDPETGIFRNKYTRAPNAIKGNKAGTLHKTGYVHLLLNKRQLKAHRVAWYLITKVEPVDIGVDHEDLNRSNNRFTNLRLATASQNGANSLYKGYYYNKEQKKFIASIRVDGKFIYLGVFAREIDARAAYVKKHAEIFGAFSPYRATVQR